MDNSMDVDEVDFQVKNETEEVATVTTSENTTEQPEQPVDDDEFGDDNIDIDEDDINFLMSPQPTKTATFSTPSTSTNLNFNSTQNSVTSPKPREYVTSLTGTQSSISRFSQMDGDTMLFYSNLTKYYNYLFPTKKYYDWLSYGNVDKKYFPNREFSFTLHQDVYMRFQSFEDEKEFKRKLIEYNPKKIDIGAVYNRPPKFRKNSANSAFKPVEKELVFDIDMTDYDDIRTCCVGGNICRKCWTFMNIAIKIIDRALRDDFGFKKILWVYSGRRGVHCWVCDERARKLSENARKAIVGYLEVVKGGEQQYRKVRLPNVLHPSLEYAYKIVKEYFPKLILEDMEDIFSNKDYYKRLLSIVTEVPEKIPSESDETISKKEEKILVATLCHEWETSGKLAKDKWQELVESVNNLENKLGKQSKYERKNEIANFERDVMFQYTYPRLDFNVSLRLNHLLKSPFCIHPGTGRVCVPIDPADCDNFNPLGVPTLDTLCKEIDEIKQHSDKVTANELQKSTSIAPYIKQFSDFVKSLEDEISRMRHIKRDLDEQELEF